MQSTGFCRPGDLVRTGLDHVDDEAHDRFSVSDVALEEGVPEAAGAAGRVGYWAKVYAGTLKPARTAAS